MARIAGINLPKDKRIEISLTYIYGVGKPSANSILKKINISPDTRTKNLTEEEVNRLREIIEKEYRTEGELRREVAANIKRLKDVGSYRGSRHIKNLPISGRTKTNSRTRRGNKRVTMGSGRKSATQKT